MEEILNQENQNELRKLLNFFSNKRNQSIQQTRTMLKQTKEKVLNDDMFSREEVAGILDDLSKEVQSTMESELGNLTHMCGVYIKMLMYQAQAKNVFLTAQTGFLENEKAIEQMKILERNTGGVMKKGTQGGRLPTLQASFNNDPSLVQRNTDLQERIQVLEAEIVDKAGRIQVLYEENERLVKSQMGREEQGKEIESSNQMIQRLQTTEVRIIQLQLQTKEQLIISLKAEQEKRLNESKQFQTLKKLIQSKNEQIKQLREQQDINRIGN